MQDLRKNPKGFKLHFRKSEFVDHQFVVDWVSDDQYLLLGSANLILDSSLVSRKVNSEFNELLDELENYEEDQWFCSDGTPIHIPKDSVYLDLIRIYSLERRGQSLGSEMLLELEEFLSQKGFTTIFLTAVPAVRTHWYTKMGYSVICPNSKTDDIKRIDWEFCPAHPLLMKDIRRLQNPAEYTFPQMFHASPKLLKKIKPQDHYLSPNHRVVFGTPSLSIALIFLQPWDDTMLELGVVGEDPPYLIEMFRGAFKSIFDGKIGYVYEVDPHTFYQTSKLTHFEAISKKSPTILKIYKINDALKALKQSEIQMIYYKDAKRFRKNKYQAV